VFDAVSPNLMIVLDRSCSMHKLSAGISKWDAAVASIGALMSLYRDQVRWGLTLFPDKGDGKACQQHEIQFPIADGQEDAVSAFLTAALDPSHLYYPDGPCDTPIDSGLFYAATDAALAATDRPSYLMLVTDGQQSKCNNAGGDQGVEQILDGLRLLRGIQTFVVGFGEEVDPEALDRYAVAGGTARAGTPVSYYSANSPTDLAEQLGEIGATIVSSCEFQLSSSPPDVSNMTLAIEPAALAPASAPSDWSYSSASNSITVSGATCDRLREGAFERLQVTMGCPLYVPPETVD
jgi:hypothetical protein